MFVNFNLFIRSNLEMHAAYVGMCLAALDEMIQDDNDFPLKCHL